MKNIEKIFKEIKELKKEKDLIENRIKNIQLENFGICDGGLITIENIIKCFLKLKEKL